MTILRFDTFCMATDGGRPRFQGAVGMALMALAATGCAGAEATAAPPQVATAPPPPPAMPVRERGNDKLITEVGPAGGILELGDGARVDIPKGAFSEPVSVTFAKGQHTTAFDNREYEKTLGRTLELAPAVEARAPIVVSIPLASLPEGYEAADLTLATEVLAERQRDYQEHATQTRWDYMQAQHQDGRAQASLTYVPGMRLQFLVSRGD